jgi:hypothetical protein
MEAVLSFEMSQNFYNSGEDIRKLYMIRRENLNS